MKPYILNYFLIFILNKNNPNNLIESENLHYFEKYENGTECILGDIVVPRTSIVEYVCSPTHEVLEVSFSRKAISKFYLKFIEIILNYYKLKII